MITFPKKTASQIATSEMLNINVNVLLTVKIKWQYTTQWNLFQIFYIYVILKKRCTSEDHTCVKNIINISRTECLKMCEGLQLSSFVKSKSQFDSLDPQNSLNGIVRNYSRFKLFLNSSSTLQGKLRIFGLFSNFLNPYPNNLYWQDQG